MSQGKTFKLIVQTSDTCLDLLRYMNKNITTINQLGVRVAVEKISKQEFDDDMVETLRKKGITRLPALIAPDGKLFIGIKRITDLFDKNLNSARNDSRTNPSGEYGGPATGAEMGSNPDLTDFWQAELFAGQDRKGRHIPRKDKDEEEDEAGDIQRRLDDYRRTEPKHRRSDGGRERDIDPPVQDRARRGRQVEEEPEDNIADSDDEGYDDPAPPTRRGSVRPPRTSSSGDARGDDMDQRMMAAWLDNNSGE